jgi:hypothetical protein
MSWFRTAIDNDEVRGEKERDSMSDQHLRLLLLGQSGAGKTRLAIETAPPGGIFVIRSDMGGALASARGRPFEASDLVDTQQKFETAFKLALKGAVEGTYRTVIFDTISEYSRAILEDELRANPTNTQAAFGNMGRRVLSAAGRLVKQVPAHLVIVSHSAYDKDGDTALDVDGQSGRRLPNLLDDSWLLKVTSKQPWKSVLTRKPGGILKSRTVADDCLELEPSLGALLAARVA